MTVDEFIAKRVLPEFQPVVESLRQSLRELAPQAQETISYGIPMYRVNKAIAVISPTKKDITLAFSRGAEFEDKYGLLRGVGKVEKHLKFKSTGEIDRAVLEYYLTQALELDSK